MSLVTFDSRDAWHDARGRPGVPRAQWKLTGTRLAALLGVHRFKSAWDLVEALEGREEAVSDSRRATMDVGNILEDPILRLAGATPAASGGRIACYVDEEQGLLASVDGWHEAGVASTPSADGLYHLQEKVGAEAKTMRFPYDHYQPGAVLERMDRPTLQWCLTAGLDGTPPPCPPEHLLQVYTYLEVTGWPEWRIHYLTGYGLEMAAAVLGDLDPAMHSRVLQSMLGHGIELGTVTIKADPTFQDWLIGAALERWHGLQDGTWRPDFDDSAACKRAHREAWAKLRDGVEVDGDLADRLAELHSVKRALADLKAEHAYLVGEIKRAMLEMGAHTIQAGGFVGKISKAGALSVKETK